MKKFLVLGFLAACGQPLAPGGCLIPAQGECIAFTDVPQKDGTLTPKSAKLVCDEGYGGLYVQSCGTGGAFVGTCALPPQDGVEDTYYLYGDIWNADNGAQICANSKGTWTPKK